ncbi:MAG: 30S ribosomal protein S7 [Chlamydiae bacterium]|nr:30S ribosomal protein S7 [Chlamydiota bacterium]
MARRRRAEKRQVEPDSVYESLVLSKFINKIMLDGKKNTAKKIVYSALEKFAKKVRVENPIEAFEIALDNARPSLEVKSRRIGGSTYQIPIEVHPQRSYALAMRWIIDSSRKKVGKSMEDGLMMELSDCYQNQGSTIKKKDDTHRMAEANKAFAHFKW